MIGNGLNKKSIAYVGNVAHLLKKLINEKTKGFQILNYTDEPDLTMNELVNLIYDYIGIKRNKIKIPYLAALIIGYLFDVIALIFKRDTKISSIRVKKFCSNSIYDSRTSKIYFDPPYKLKDALRKTIKYEFLKSKK